MALAPVRSVDWPVLQSVHRIGTVPQHRLAEVIGRQRSTLNGAVQRLLAGGWLVRAGQQAHGRGRPAILLAVDRSAGCFAGIDVTAEQIDLALVGMDGTLLERVTSTLPARRTPEIVVDQIDLALRGLLSRAQVSPTSIAGIWAGINGAVNDKGVVVTCASLGWKNVPLRELLADRYGCRVLVQGGASALNAAAEWLMGAGREVDSFVYYHVGRGISARYVQHGQPLAGATQRAGELGHVVVEPGGPRCACGNRGCLEAVASGPALAQAIRKTSRQRLPATLRGTLRRTNPADAADVVRTACQHFRGSGKDELSQLLQRAAERLALGAAMAVAAYDPQALVLGGYVLENNAPLVKAIQRRLRASVLDWQERGLSVLSGQIMSQERAVGGAAEMCQRFWANPEGVVGKS